MKTGKTPIIFAISILTVSLAVLVYFLYRSYKEEQRNYEETVNKVLVLTNFTETIERCQSVGPHSKANSSAVYLKAPGQMLNGRTPSIYMTKRFMADSTGKAKNGDAFSKLFEDAESRKDKDPAVALVEAMNSVDRGIYDIDFSIFDSLLVSSFTASGISTPYKLELVYRDSTQLNKMTSTPGFKEPRIWYSYKNELQLDDDGSAKYIYTAAPMAYLLSRIDGPVILAILAFIIIALSLVTLYVSYMKARDAEKLQVEFTHLVTHNLNNPLAIIRASMEALYTKADINHVPDPQVKQYLDIIGRQANNLTNQVKSILKPYSLSGVKDDLSKQEIRIADKLGDIAAQVKLAYQSIGFELKIDAPADTVISANEEMLDDVLSNLIQNAIKYSPGDTKIELSLTRTQDGKVIAVKDNGMGIPQEKIGHLFERYYKVEQLSSTPGYGIGLNYVKQVIDLHHWQIKVDSTVGEGSTFSIIIPD